MKRKEIAGLTIGGRSMPGEHSMPGGHSMPGTEGPPFFIMGPCVIEDERTTLSTLEALLKITAGLKLPFIFKASYDKANRTSLESFRGPGLKLVRWPTLYRFRRSCAVRPISSWRSARAGGRSI